MPPKVLCRIPYRWEEEETSKSNVFTLLKFAPSTFWKVGLVQFFSWFAFMYMWTYTNGTVAANCWGVDMLAHDATMTKGYQEAGNWGRYSLCHSGYRISSLGNGSSTVQEHQTGILLLAYLRCCRFRSRILRTRPIRSLHSIPPHPDVHGQLSWQCLSPSSPTHLRVMGTWELISDCSTELSVYHRLLLLLLAEWYFRWLVPYKVIWWL